MNTIKTSNNNQSLGKVYENRTRSNRISKVTEYNGNTVRNWRIAMLLLLVTVSIIACNIGNIIAQF